MRDIDQARARYEDRPLTERWALARATAPEDAPVLRQAAREELQAIAEEVGEHAHAGRIRRLAKLHREALA